MFRKWKKFIAITLVANFAAIAVYTAGNPAESDSNAVTFDVLTKHPYRAAGYSAAAVINLILFFEGYSVAKKKEQINSFGEYCKLAAKAVGNGMIAPLSKTAREKLGDIAHKTPAVITFATAFLLTGLAATTDISYTQLPKLWSRGSGDGPNTNPGPNPGGGTTPNPGGGGTAPTPHNKITTPFEEKLEKRNKKNNQKCYEEYKKALLDEYTNTPNQNQRTTDLLAKKRISLGITE